jgi:Zn-dependent protease with chaperone function
MQANFSNVQTRYAIFRWMKRIAWVCLAAGACAFVVAGLGVLFSIRSQNALYWSLRLSWTILRCFALIEVVGQGILVVALSFWVTAFWMEQYVPKLIILAAIMAFLAVAMLVKAIFQKLPGFTAFDGRLVKPEAAPDLWRRVKDMATKMATAPPDQLFVGIDDNFFVTEHTVNVGDTQYTGRTLFASLSLLKTLSRSEADAVLAHELAHFSGADTQYSRRTSPLLGKYFIYLQALYTGGLSRPVFYFMFFFWNLYQFSLNKIRREREFRADRLGADMTSAADIARALVKTSSYSRYRHKVQSTLFGKDENVETMDVFQRIENGFPAFIDECTSGSELAEAHTPHPFDSHPPLDGRIQNLGLNSATMLKERSTLPAVADTWFSAINGAANIEAEQWKAFESAFHKAHQENLAWRFKPEGESEIQHVRKYFPDIEFKTAKGVAATLDYEKVRLSDWEVPVFFSTVTKCKLEESFGRHRLVIEYHVDKKMTRKVSYKDLKRPDADFLKTFQKYYGRHLTAKNYREQKAAEPKVSI